MTSTATTSSLTIERLHRPSVPARIVYPLAFATARAGLELAGRLGEFSPRPHPQIFRIANFADLAAAPLPLMRGTRRRRLALNRCGAEWIWHQDQQGPDASDAGAVLFFQGGAFIAGGLNAYRRLLGRMAMASGAPVLNVAYRRLPNYHITDTVADGLDAYKHLLAQGFPARKIIFSGDSAGGFLAFAVAIAARDAGLPVPGGITAISPAGDLDSTARLAHPNANRDAILSPRAVKVILDWGYAKDGTLDPAWSPVNHEFDGLPTTLIICSASEVLLSDAERLAQRCAAANVPCRLQIWDHQIHGFPVLADVLPEGRAAFRVIEAFHRSVLTPS
ncbi:alpha/beta hydrolase fold domain-containing protein [Antrihabitans sp. YC2-6]|uniref:alpha/beta hydrolase fold domain-containing protein n=1 Tax=Antrihabitans sp. YC2-6 TaxID=2799498 RepID=UPI0018F72A19|nr:alpha/beta hydrolase fold domain-containing protein [Antrihabitans sp. YC2-6]MBJ8346723.1 alpha/beta hydrolase fold domain-containing protein [Antrihabitans sp. YC2-6]